MGTTRIKVIDLSSQQAEVKTSRKHAEKLTGVTKIKATKRSKVAEEEQRKIEKAITEGTEKKTESTELVSPTIGSVPSVPSAPSVIKTKSKIAGKQKRHLGKKYLQVAQLIDKNKIYPAKEAFELLYKTSFTKFDPAVEIHLNVTDKNIRGRANLPHPVGGKTKHTRYLIFSDKKAITESPEKEQKAQKISVPPKPSVPSAIIIWGNEQTIDQIESGKLKPRRDFDTVLSQSKFMPFLARVAKILGPAGLMPNPKDGTIVDGNPQKFITMIGKTDSGFVFQTDPTAPIIHTKLGQLSTKQNHLEENLKALVSAVGPSRIKKATLTTTMGPGIAIDVNT